MPKKIEIHKAEFIISALGLNQCPKGDKPEYAFIGRSNVGKSSLINMLTNRKDLAKTSSTPGKTQLINYFLVNTNWYMVDLPGYGWAKVGKQQKQQWSENVRRYLLGRNNLATLFILVDIRLNPQESDIEFINWAGENGIPIALIFTKADKLSKNKVSGSVNRYVNHLKNFWEEIPVVFISSAETRQGRDEILKYIFEINKSLGFKTNKILFN
jgi:GTP-binding protein